MHTPHYTDRSRDLSPSRRGALSIVMWVFGLSTTLLLVGLWGRSVAVDQATVEESAQAVVNADVARDRIYEWIEDAVVESSSIASADIAPLVDAWRTSPEFNRAIDNVVGGFVAALFAPPGTPTVIDIRDAMAPAIPVIVGDLRAQSLPVEEATLVEALDDASSIELDTSGAQTVSTIAGEARVILTRVVVLAFLVMITSGVTAVILAHDNYAMLRTLAIRVTLSALSFAIFFRLGAWALDPDGGRSPIAAGGSVILGSNGHVFFLIAAVASVIGGYGAWIAWQRKRRPSKPGPVAEEPVVLGDSCAVTDDDTREFVTV